MVQVSAPRPLILSPFLDNPSPPSMSISPAHSTTLYKPVSSDQRLTITPTTRKLSNVTGRQDLLPHYPPVPSPSTLSITTPSATGKQKWKLVKNIMTIVRPKARSRDSIHEVTSSSSSSSISSGFSRHNALTRPSPAPTTQRSKLFKKEMPLVGPRPRPHIHHPTLNSNPSQSIKKSQSQPDLRESAAQAAAKRKETDNELYSHFPLPFEQPSAMLISDPEFDRKSGEFPGDIHVHIPLVRTRWNFGSDDDDDSGISLSMESTKMVLRRQRSLTLPNMQNPTPISQSILGDSQLYSEPDEMDGAMSIVPGPILVHPRPRFAIEKSRKIMREQNNPGSNTEQRRWKNRSQTLSSNSVPLKVDVSNSYPTKSEKKIDASSSLADTVEDLRKEIHLDDLPNETSREITENNAQYHRSQTVQDSIGTEISLLKALGRLHEKPMRNATKTLQESKRETQDQREQGDYKKNLPQRVQRKNSPPALEIVINENDIQFAPSLSSASTEILAKNGILTNNMSGSRGSKDNMDNSILSPQMPSQSASLQPIQSSSPLDGLVSPRTPTSRSKKTSKLDKLLADLNAAELEFSENADIHPQEKQVPMKANEISLKTLSESSNNMKKERGQNVMVSTLKGMSVSEKEISSNGNSNEVKVLNIRRPSRNVNMETRSDEKSQSKKQDDLISIKRVISQKMKGTGINLHIDMEALNTIRERKMEPTIIEGKKQEMSFMKVNQMNISSLSPSPTRPEFNYNMVKATSPLDTLMCKMNMTQNGFPWVNDQIMPLSPMGYDENGFFPIYQNPNEKIGNDTEPWTSLRRSSKKSKQLSNAGQDIQTPTFSPSFNKPNDIHPQYMMRMRRDKYDDKFRLGDNHIYEGVRSPQHIAVANNPL